MFLLGALADVPNEIWAVVASSFIAACVYLLRPKVKLVWSSTHLFVHRFKSAEDKEALIHTAAYTILNLGRETARSVEIVFNFAPQTCSVWPQRHYLEKTNPEGRWSLVFETLNAKERIDIHLLGVTELPELLTLRCEGRSGVEIQTWTVKRYPAWIYTTALLGLFLGAAAAVYGLIVVVQLLSTLFTVQT